ncbi:MAG: hypothetical protein WEC75_10850, partial [Dehalococcoidia bacterium]
RPIRFALLAAAPMAAVGAGLGAEFAEFRELRPLLRALFLSGVGLGVLATASALIGTRAGVAAFAAAVAAGVLTWAEAETVYVVLHSARGEAFEFDAFGAKPANALALVLIHATFLGAPTGMVAGAILQAASFLSGRRDAGRAPARGEAG